MFLAKGIIFLILVQPTVSFLQALFWALGTIFKEISLANITTLNMLAELKQQSSVVAALPERWLKWSNFLRMKKGRKKQKRQGKKRERNEGREGKKWKEIRKERKRNKTWRYKGKKKKMCKKKPKCLACYQERNIFLSPGSR